MKAIALALLLAGPLACSAQAGSPSPAPSAPKIPDLGDLFSPPPALPPGKPHFKLQIPKGQSFQSIPQTIFQTPQPFINPKADPGILMKPRSFDYQPARPAPNPELYPDLKIMPVEIASLDPGIVAPWPGAKAQPIPRTWPKAKIEPIPTTWSGYTVVPITAESGR